MRALSVVPQRSGAVGVAEAGGLQHLARRSVRMALSFTAVLSIISTRRASGY